MIKTETITIKGVTYDHTYSDAGKFIMLDGIEYADAIDPEGSGRKTAYIETDLDIDPKDESEIESIIAEVKRYE